MARHGGRDEEREEAEEEEEEAVRCRAHSECCTAMGLEWSMPASTPHGSKRWGHAWLRSSRAFCGRRASAAPESGFESCFCVLCFFFFFSLLRVLRLATLLLLMLLMLLMLLLLFFFFFSLFLFLFLFLFFF